MNVMSRPARIQKFAAHFHAAPLALHRQALDALFHDALVVDGDVEWRFEYALVNGIAIIPVLGVLSKCDWWGCSYDWMRIGFDAALQDPAVRAIVLQVNSPGGTVDGCFDFADHVFASRGQKPIWAILDESAYSAAYAIASAADHITVPRTGGAGSIGVLTCHVDMSKMLENAGIKVTYIQFGAKKTDGAPEKPLNDEEKACLQSDIDEMGELFVNTVARNRGISVDTVKNTEAGTYLGPASVTLGLCDAVMAPDAAFLALLDKLG